VVYYEEEETFTLASDAALEEIQSRRVRAFKSAEMQESASVSRAVADTDGPVSIDFGGVSSAALVFIESDAEVDVKLSGASVGFLLSPTAASPKASLKIVNGSVTGIVITNLQVGTSANVTVVLAGAA
jgi:hypothetical protein